MLMQRNKKRTKNKLTKRLLVLVAVLVVAGLVFLLLELTHTIHVFNKKPQTKAIVIVGKPVAPVATATPSTTNSATSQPTEKNPDTSASQPGGATDTNGSSVPSTPSNQWATSATGYITVKSPLANATISDGATIAGSAEVNQVDYTLIDNTVGVISQGQLNVANGNFSGVLHFQSKGTGGRLDVYSTNAQGVEYNEVEINVSF
jgi:cytoskeletal protein RodZ